MAAAPHDDLLSVYMAYLDERGYEAVKIPEATTRTPDLEVSGHESSFLNEFKSPDLLLDQALGRSSSPILGGQAGTGSASAPHRAATATPKEPPQPAGAASRDPPGTPSRPEIGVRSPPARSALSAVSSPLSNWWR